MEIGFSTIGNNLKTSFGIRKPEESEKSFDKAVDDLLDRTFPDKKQNIPECGDFAPVYVDIESPVDDPSIKNGERESSRLLQLLMKTMFPARCLQQKETTLQ